MDSFLHDLHILTAKWASVKVGSGPRLSPDNVANDAVVSLKEATSGHSTVLWKSLVRIRIMGYHVRVRMFGLAESLWLKLRWKILS